MRFLTKSIYAILHNMQADKLGQFFKKFKKLHFKKGQVIIHPGMTPPGVFYLAKGYVKAYSTSEEGKELTIIIFKPEDIFPYSWAISGIENKYYYETMTAIELCRVPKEELIRFIKENPEVLLTLSNRIIVRMMGLVQRMEYLVFGNAYSKVASILVICAERFGSKDGKNIVIQVPLTHKDIANLLGVTRETVSVEMKKLERKGLINSRGKHVIVRNLKKLEEESLIESS